MKLTPLSSTLVPSTEKLLRGDPSQSQDKGFLSTLEKSISQVDNLLKTADKSTTELAVGKVENLHQAMINVEKAETALKLLVQVRNKVIDAYQEVMRMQV